MTLLKDIQNIKYGCDAFDNNPQQFYGGVWNKFQNALEKEDCSYWGRLYEDIFKRSFKLDNEALEKRVNIPPKFQELGAASVAFYLMRPHPSWNNSISEEDFNFLKRLLQKIEPTELKTLMTEMESIKVPDSDSNRLVTLKEKVASLSTKHGLPTCHSLAASVIWEGLKRLLF